MPRLLAPGAEHYVTFRVVDRSWQLVGDQEGAQYLAQLSSHHRFA